MSILVALPEEILSFSPVGTSTVINSSLASLAKKRFTVKQEVIGKDFTLIINPLTESVKM